LSFEGDHGISRVRDGNIVQEGNRSWDSVGAKESKDSKLGQTSVVDLSTEASFLGFLRHVLVEAEGIVQVKDEVNIVSEKSERRVFSGLTSLHVMGHGSTTALVPKLESRDDGEDLPLSTNGDSVPLSLGAEFSGRVGGSGKSLGPGEVEVRLNNVSNEGKHSNTSVFDFGLTEESNGGFVSLSPEVLFGEVEGIVESNLWVELFGHFLKVGLGGSKGVRGGFGGGGGESGGPGGDAGKDSGGKFHFDEAESDLYSSLL